MLLNRLIYLQISLSCIALKTRKNAFHFAGAYIGIAARGEGLWFSKVQWGSSRSMSEM